VEGILAGDVSVNGKEILGFALPTPPSRATAAAIASSVFQPVAHPLPRQSTASRETHSISGASDGRVPVDAPEAPTNKAEPPEDSHTTGQTRDNVDSPSSWKNSLDQNRSAVESPSSEVDRMLNLFFSSIRSESRSPPQMPLFSPDESANRSPVSDKRDRNVQADAASVPARHTVPSRQPVSRLSPESTPSDRFMSTQTAGKSEERLPMSTFDNEDAKASDEWASVSVRHIGLTRSMTPGLQGGVYSSKVVEDEQNIEKRRQQDTAAKPRSSGVSASHSLESSGTSDVVQPIATSKSGAGFELPSHDSLSFRVGPPAVTNKESHSPRRQDEETNPRKKSSFQHSETKQSLVAGKLNSFVLSPRQVCDANTVGQGNFASTAGLLKGTESREEKSKEEDIGEQTHSPKELMDSTIGRVRQELERSEQPKPEENRLSTSRGSLSPETGIIPRTASLPIDGGLLDQSARQFTKKRVTMQDDGVFPATSESRVVRRDALNVGDPCGVISDTLNSVAAVGISGLGDAGLRSEQPATSSKHPVSLSQESQPCKNIAASSFLSNIGKSWSKALSPMFGTPELALAHDEQARPPDEMQELDLGPGAKSTMSPQLGRAVESVPSVGNYKPRERRESDADELQIEVRLAPSELMSFEDSSFARDRDLKISESQRADDATPIYYLSAVQMEVKGEENDVKNGDSMLSGGPIPQNSSSPKEKGKLRANLLVCRLTCLRLLSDLTTVRFVFVYRCRLNESYAKCPD
jgi:hypothetical protein